MTEQRLWVTAYHAPDREVLVTQRPGWTDGMIFDFNQHLEPRELSREALDAVRASGITPRFYSIPDPF
jgi:hypothetical protein